MGMCIKLLLVGMCVQIAAVWLIKTHKTKLCTLCPIVTRAKVNLILDDLTKKSHWLDTFSCYLVMLYTDIVLNVPVCSSFAGAVSLTLSAMAWRYYPNRWNGTVPHLTACISWPSLSSRTRYMHSPIKHQGIVYVPIKSERQLIMTSYLYYPKTYTTMLSYGDPIPDYSSQDAVGISLHTSTRNMFSWYLIFADGNNILHPVV